MNKIEHYEFDPLLLVDAINEFSQGVILLSADDNVIFCNKRQKELFPGVADLLVTGTPFETIVRAFAERGLAPEAVDREEEWIAERMAAHLTGEAVPFEQLSADGTWVEVREMKMANGCRMGIRTDVTERRRANAALLQSEQRFQDFADVAADWFWEQDENLRFSFISTDFGMITETTQEDFLGKTRRETGLFDMDEEKLQAHEAKLLAREPFSNFEFSRARPNGEMVDISISGKPVYNTAGRFTGYRGVGRNITAQKQAEKISLHNQQRIRNFAEAASDVFWERDAEGRFTYLSDRFYEVTGDQRGSVIGKTSEDMGRVFEPPAGGNDPREDVAKRRPYRNLVSSRTYADGRKHWTRSGGVPVFDEHGGFIGYRGSSTDITDEVEAREVADQANRRFLDALDSMPNSVDLYDSDDRLIYQNDIARQHRLSLYDHDFAGATFEEFIRAAVTHGVVPDAKDREEQWIRERIKRHRNPEGVLVVQGRGGSDRWHEMREHRTPDGSTLVIWIDITESVLQEEQLRQAQKMEVLGQLTGGVAHDFNNLLAVIMGNLELLLEKSELNSSQNSLANRALTATQRGADLTHRLLAFSRRQPLQPILTDVNQLIKGTQDLLVRTLGETIEIELVIGAGLWQCEVDPGQLENAILNLSINARDAMPVGGKLTIETANARLDDVYAAGLEDVTPGQYVLLATSDTGTGMTQEVIEQAFDPFFTTKEVGKGSGLGLSMIYGFAKQSGGHARIYSELGEGTTVKIYLPRSIAGASAGAKLETGAQATMDTAARGEVIMVVEDDADVRAVAVSILDELGYEVLEAGEANAALEQIQLHSSINLLLTDVILPGGMGGRQLAERACELLPGLKVLYMSGYTENAIMHHGRLDEGVQLLEKPFGRADLALKVRQILDSEP